MYEKEADSSPFCCVLLFLLLFLLFFLSLKYIYKTLSKIPSTRKRHAFSNCLKTFLLYNVLPVVVFRVVGRTGRLPRAKLLRRGVLRRRATNGASFSWWSFLSFFLSFFLFPLLLLRFWMRAIFNPKEEDECFWINALLTRKISFDALGGGERLLETRRMTDAFSRAMLPPPSTTTEHVVERVLLYHRSRTQKRDRVGQKWSRFEPKVQRRETVRPRKMPRGEHHRPSVRKQVPRRAGRRDGERLYLVRVERWGNLV